MRNTFQLFTAALPLVAAYPGVVQSGQDDVTLETRAHHKFIYPKVPPPRHTTNRDNCGSHGNCTVFNAEDQLVKVGPGSGNEWMAPTTTDLRGQCPGLNAAANHGFLPRSGIASTFDTINGLGAAYSMSKDLAIILSVIAIGISGDPIAEVWSIGSGFKGTLGLLGHPQGIVGTHNRYEGDASIVRGDAYLYNGHVGFFEMHKWEHLYSLLGKDGLTQDKAAAQAYYTAKFSILNNPYYFSEPFSGLVAPDAHNFVVNFMSNHSEQDKGGNLHGNVLKSFFAVTGEPGNFKHHRGMERIPDNWYKRPTSEPMDTIDTNVDTVRNNGMYPGIIRFGGNTGKRDSFVGINTGDLTGGVYNGKDILNGNALTCIFLQATQAGLVDAGYPLLQSAGQIRAFLTSKLSPYTKQFNCPELKHFNNEIFKKYPGASYKGQGE